MLKGKTVVLGVTGSIAAYKIANLASMLSKLHADIHVLMTQNATNFINPITFETLTGNKCLIDTFDRNFQFNVEHVSLAKKADVVLIAPASANVIGKLANGIADDMLTTTVMACKCKKIISPAMNTNMYENPIVQDNIAKLKRFGMQVIEPDVGLLACKDVGAGKMPSRKMINDIIESGVIGEVTAVTANLSYTVSHVERIRKPELAGGALLDVGVYPINFASMVLGDKVKDVKATAIFQNGVDILDSIAMVFEGDRMATLQCGAREISDRMGSIFGTRGYMQVQNINNPEKITVFDTEHKEVASYVVPEQISGYEYEVESCMKAIQEGKLECPEMPHAETIRIMKIMDDIRKSWNYEIPCIE